MAERGPRLLIVDDEARILSALQRALRREGYEIVTAESAREALRVLEERAVRAAIIDAVAAATARSRELGAA